MNFGKYLIENSIIEKEDFISTVVKQVNTQPTVLSSLIELNILDVEKLLEVIFHSFDNSTDILSSWRQLGGSEEDIQKVKDFQAQHTLNIVDTLVSDGVASKDTVLDAFKKFQEQPQVDVVKEPEDTKAEVEESDDAGDSIISAAALESLKELQGGDIDMSQFETASEVVEEKTDIVEPEPSSSNEEVEISTAALESLKELGGVPEDELAALEKVTETLNSENDVDLEPSALDYISIYDDKKNQKINKILKMIKDAAQNDSDIANYFNSLFRELHVVKGAAVLVDAKYSKKLIEIWELIIDKVFSMSNPELKAWFFSYEEALLGTSNILWNIREAIKGGSSEEKYMEDESVRNSYLANITELKKIITEIS